MQYKINYIKLNNFNFNEVVDFIKKKNDFFQIIDSEKIISEVQIVNALKKMNRFYEQNKKVKLKENLFLIYISYTKQIEDAIKISGIKYSSVYGIVIYKNEEDFNALLNIQGIEKIERNVPIDNPELDKRVFSDMSYLDLIL